MLHHSIKGLFTFFLFLFSFNNINAQTDTAAWLFPIYFEDATGAKDTIYIGYDKKAINGLGFDTNFNEVWKKIDTSVFNAYLFYYPGFSGGDNYPLTTDSVIKINISNAEIIARIGFHKGQMPLIMRWDDSLFYSDSLPLSDFPPQLSGIPRARGSLECGGEPCIADGIFVLSDYPSGHAFGQAASDSVVFPAGGSGEFTVDVKIKIDPIFAPTITFIETKSSFNERIRIFPNPFHHELIIQTDDRSISYELYNLLSQKILEGSVRNNNRFIIDVSSQPQGIYYLKIITSKHITFLRKFIKIY